MRRFQCVLILFIVICGIGRPAGTAPSADAERARSVVFKDVRVFDGKTILPRCTVVVEGSKIVRLGTDAEIPPGAVVVAGEGLTLLPGLIDSHVHAFSPGELRRSLVFGVTTVMDMMTTVAFMQQMKAKQEKTGTPDMADLFSAGVAATAPGSHGTEYGGNVPTLTKPEEAAAFVAARKAEGSDYLKIMYGMDKRAFGRDVVAALTAGASEQGLLTVVHVATRQRAFEAVEAGVNGLAHCFADAPPEEEFLRLMKNKDTFVIPTLSVMSDLADARKADLIHDARLVPYLIPDLLAALSVKTPLTNAKGLFFAVAEETARRIHGAGLRILAGSDSGNRGTTHGPSLHGELELLVAAGLTPVEVLASATSIPAQTFGLNDRGRIVPGLRADLLLVRGNPAEDITTTRDIVGVWKAGRRLDRETYRARVEGLQKTWRETGILPPPDGSESGLISDFDAGNFLPRFGFVWFEMSDKMMGGQSYSLIEAVKDGAEGSPMSMSISGQINPGAAIPWAGAAYYPGSTEWLCANLSNWNAISFWARGDAREGLLMVMLKDRAAPAVQTFAVGEEWRRYEIPFEKLGKSDGSDIAIMLFGAGGAPGPFKFQIDQVRLIRIGDSDRR